MYKLGLLAFLSDWERWHGISSQSDLINTNNLESPRTSGMVFIRPVLTPYGVGWIW